MGRCLGSLAGVLLGAALGLQAAAEESPTAGADHRTGVDVRVHPWSSIGKLHNSVGGACTAAVIGRDKVLTAAHCLYHGRARRFLPATSLHVLLGYERGRYGVHARITRYETGSGYDPQRRAKTLAADWAVLTLAEPLPPAIRPLSLAEALPDAGMRVASGGYGQDRAHAMTADMDCRILGALTRGSLLAHDCHALRGTSGAPLLSAGSDLETARVVGLNIAVGRIGDREVRIAIPAAIIARALATGGT